MNVDVVKAARHTRRRTEFSHITISPEDSSLVVHTVAIIQLLDQDGKVIHEEKRAQQEKIKVKSLSQFSDIRQTANNVIKQSKNKIPDNKIRLVETRLNELIKARNSGNLGFKTNAERQDFSAEFSRETSGTGPANIRDLNNYLEMLYDPDIEEQTKGTHSILKLAQVPNNIPHLVDHPSLMNALLRMLGERESRDLDSSLAKNILSICFCISKMPGYGEILISQGVAERVQTIIAEELRMHKRHVQEVSDTRTRLRKLQDKASSRDQDQPRPEDQEAIRSLTRLLKEKLPEYTAKQETQTTLFRISTHLLLNLAICSAEEEDRMMERHLMRQISELFTFCTDPIPGSKQNKQSVEDLMLSLIQFVQALAENSRDLFIDELLNCKIVENILPLVLHPPSPTVEDSALQLLSIFSTHPILRQDIGRTEAIYLRFIDILHEGTPGLDDEEEEDPRRREKDRRGSAKRKSAAEAEKRSKTGLGMPQVFFILSNLSQEPPALKMINKNSVLIDMVLTYAINITTSVFDEGKSNPDALVFTFDPPGFLNEAMELLIEFCQPNKGRFGVEAVERIFRSMDNCGIKLLAQIAIRSLQPSYFQLLAAVCSFFATSNITLDPSTRTRFAKYAENFNKLLPAFVDMAREIENTDTDLRYQLNNGRRRPQPSSSQQKEKKKPSNFTLTARTSLQQQTTDRLQEAEMLCEQEGTTDGLSIAKAHAETLDRLIQEHQNIVASVFSMLGTVDNASIDIPTIARKSDLLGFLHSVTNRIQTEAARRESLRQQQKIDEETFAEEEEEDRDTLMDVFRLIGRLSTMPAILPGFASSGWARLIVSILSQCYGDEELLETCIYICYNLLFDDKTRSIVLLQGADLIEICLALWSQGGDPQLRQIADSVLDVASEHNEKLKVEIRKRKFEEYNRDWCDYIDQEDARAQQVGMRGGGGRQQQMSRLTRTDPPHPEDDDDDDDDMRYQRQGVDLDHRQMLYDDYQEGEEEEEENYSTYRQRPQYSG